MAPLGNLRESEDVPQNRECIKNAINVKRWVDRKCCIEDEIPEVAAVVCKSVGARKRKWTGWRVGSKLVRVTSIVACLCQFVKSS